MNVRCNKNGGSCGYFTDRKTYKARPIGSGRVAEITDDHGNTRVVSLDPTARCPHITIGYGDRYKPHACVGTWEVIP